MPLFTRRSAPEGPGSPRITPGRAKNAIAVAKVIAPAVLPVVVPVASRAAGALRDRWDQAKARRLGVPVDELGRYAGRGGALYARITGAMSALADLRAGATGPAPARQSLDTDETTLGQLTAVVRAAERMPAARRRAAHRAVSAELDVIEQRLLRTLGVQPGQR